MKKRFVAGVVCPKCAQLDVIRAWDSEDGAYLERECIECSFTDRISTGVNTPKELQTRVSAEDKRKAAEAVQFIKIIE